MAWSDAGVLAGEGGCGVGLLTLRINVGRTLSPTGAWEIVSRHQPRKNRSDRRVWTYVRTWLRRRESPFLSTASRK